MKHAFTVDVEDWFHILDCPQMPLPEAYKRFESRVVRNTNRVLKTLDDHGVRGTFFILGWVAEAYPTLVSDIVSAGHEIGVHGYAHVLASTLTDAQLEADTRRAFDVVTSAAGMAPVGYRSPGGSLLERQRWLFDLLIELGASFDSSIYPRPGGLAAAEGYPTQPYGRLEKPLYRRSKEGGNQVKSRTWIPACAGMTEFFEVPLYDSPARWSRALGISIHDP